MEGAPAASRGNTPSFAIEENAEYVDLSHKPHSRLGEGYTIPPTTKVPHPLVQFTSFYAGTDLLVHEVRLSDEGLAFAKQELDLTHCRLQRLENLDNLPALEVSTYPLCPPRFLMGAAD
jgi:hypothetical protein